MNEIKLFDHAEFGAIRTIENDGKPFFMAVDIARAMGYENPTEAVGRHCRKVNKIRHSVSGMPFNIIPESDVYRLIMRSKLPSAERFQDWVCEEVLPSIRQHGMYGTDDFVEQAMANPEAMIKIISRIHKEQERRRFAEHQKAIADFQRDKAIRTKAEIGSRREATAMATASVKARENKKLKRQLAIAGEYLTVKAIPWLQDVFNLKKKSSYSEIGKYLTKLSKEHKYDMPPIPSAEWGSVKSYHADIIAHFENMVYEDETILKDLRR